MDEGRERAHLFSFRLEDMKVFKSRRKCVDDVAEDGERIPPRRPLFVLETRDKDVGGLPVPYADELAELSIGSLWLQGIGFCRVGESDL